MRLTTFRFALAFLVALGLGALQPPYAAANEEEDEVHEEEHHDLFFQHLYEPEFVLQNAGEIGLTDDQRALLIDRFVETEASVRRLELSVFAAEERLAGLLAEETIDADAVLEGAGRLLEVETETRKLYLGFLIEMHNQLTPEQRATLDAIRERE